MASRTRWSAAITAAALLASVASPGTSSEPQKSIDVLKKAVEVAPDDPALRLHLAEAAQNAIWRQAAFAAKRDLAQLALDSYAAYRTLTGQEAPGAAEFNALNIAGAASGDVCSYVAAFYNHGRQEEIFADRGPVDIDNDGRIDDVSIGSMAMGGGQWIEPEEWNEKFSFLADEDITPYSRHSLIHFLPFQSTTYLLSEVEGGPASLEQVNAGTICEFTWQYAPALTVDADPTLCARLRDAGPLPEVPVTPESIPALDIDMDIAPSGHIDFTGVATADIDGGGQSARVGYFEFTNTASASCHVFGITLLDGNVPENSSRNRTLQAAQKQALDCIGSKTFLVRVGDRVLIEVNGGRGYQRPVPPRSLLRMTGDKVETVCQVDQRPTYVPASPQ